MIATRLIGGLGNQMFQYAAARALADRLGVELVLDIRAFTTYKLHAFGLGRFSLRGRLATPDELTRWPLWMSRPCRLAQRLEIVTRWYSEPSFGYDRAWPSLKDGLILNGYFQSENYFAEIADSLLRDFIPLAPLTTENAEVARLARNSESVAIHVRRGDYVTNPNTLLTHGVCSSDYYEKAVALMHERLARPRFFVFTNDMDWARENLTLGDDAVFVSGNENSPEVDIHLMAQCRHYIIANSTFSWWGAWLNPGRDKLVVAPERWFANGLVADDLVPDDWLRL